MEHFLFYCPSGATSDDATSRAYVIEEATVWLTVSAM